MTGLHIQDGDAEQHPAPSVPVSPDPPVPAQHRAAAVPPAGAGNDPTGSAQVTRNRRLVWGSLALLLFPAFGALADLLQIMDTIGSADSGVLGYLVCGVLILLPSALAAFMFLPEQTPIAVFVWVSTLFIALGASYGGAAVGRSQVATDAHENCIIKYYKSEPPTKLRKCDRLSMADKLSLDLDDKSSRAMKLKGDGVDIKLQSGQLLPAQKDVTLSLLNAETMSNGTYPVSYEGCQKSTGTAKPVNLVDLTTKIAICVRTDRGRIAILEYVDFDPEKQSVVLNVTCWSAPVS